jgi:hypothetical protein
MWSLNGSHHWIGEEIASRLVAAGLMAIAATRGR